MSFVVYVRPWYDELAKPIKVEVEGSDISEFVVGLSLKIEDSVYEIIDGALYDSTLYRPLPFRTHTHWLTGQELTR